MRAVFVLAFILVCPFLCWSAATPGVSPATMPWEKEVKDIASNYPKYGRIDQMVRWSPANCEAPSAAGPTMRYSKSSDSETHGQKLYTLFAKHKDWEDGRGLRSQSYLPSVLKDGDGKKRGFAPIGQVIVKEGWEPIVLTLEQMRADPQFRKYGSQPKVTKGDHSKGEYLDLVDFGD